MESKDVKIVAIVGMCGSGKSTAIEYLTERGIPKVYFGGVILNAIKEAGEEITPENEKKFREGLREKEGKDFVGDGIDEPDELGGRRLRGAQCLRGAFARAAAASDAELGLNRDSVVLHGDGAFGARFHARSALGHAMTHLGAAAGLHDDVTAPGARDDSRYVLDGRHSGIVRDSPVVPRSSGTFLLPVMAPFVRGVTCRRTRPGA